MARICAFEWCLAAAIACGSVGCHRTADQGTDPASANMAPAATQDAQALPPENGSAEEQLSEAPAPPPPLPSYSQPPCPGDNYLWTPGYWAYSPDGYYWVPGVWVEAPWMGALWTPPWWGFSGGRYLWHAGYWGPHVGFYGGINYGFGYAGIGFYGGYWGNGGFIYNRAALNVDPRVVHNVYNRTVINYTPVNRISFNGPRGIAVQPNASQMTALRERRMGASPAQAQIEHEASGNRAQFATENRGRPAMVTAARPAAQNSAPAPMERNAERMKSAPAERPQAMPMNPRPEARPEARPQINAPAAGRPSPFGAGEQGRRTPQVQPAPQVHPETRPEVHAAPQGRPESHSQPEVHLPPHGPTELPKPIPPIHAEPQARTEAHPQPQAQHNPPPQNQDHQAPPPAKKK